VKLPDPPAPPFSATSGPWTVQQIPVGGGFTQQWKLAIGTDGTVPKIDRLTNLNATCTGGIEVQLRVDGNQAQFDTPFKIASPAVTATDEWVDPDNALAKTTSTFTLQFDSPGHALGTFRLTGSVFYATGVLDSRTIYTGCDTGLINIELKPGVFA
jgi:hypothetical protein